MEIPQEQQTFSEWYLSIEKQAERIVWTEFAREDAIMLAVLYKTNNVKLKSNILAAEEIHLLHKQCMDPQLLFKDP